jgi:fructokinase
VDALWKENTQIIVVTHGAKGATAYTVHTRKEQFHVPGFSVRTIDTTGAGDGFMAGMLVGILEHPDYLSQMPEILRFANAVGALSTTHRGAIPALPTRQTVDAFMSGPG